MAEQLGQALRLARRPPGEQHPGEERDHGQVGDHRVPAIAAVPGRVGSAAQRGADRPGHVLGVPAGEHPLGPRVEAVARRRGRVRLEQGARGELGRRAAERIGVAGAQVHDREVGDLAAGAAQRPGQQDRVGDLVEGGEDGGRRRPGPDVPVGEAHAEHVGEAGHHRRQQTPGVVVELPPRPSPPGLGHAEEDARPVAEGEHRAGRVPSPRRRDRHRVGRRRSRLPPQVDAVGDHPLLRGSRTAAAAAASGSSRCRRGRPGRAVRARRRRRAARPRPRPPRTSVRAGRERADELDAVPGAGDRRQRERLRPVQPLPGLQPLPPEPLRRMPARGRPGRRRLLPEHRRGHLGHRDARRGGHVRELADRRHRRQSLPLHQHAPGHRGDLRRLRVGPRQDQFAALALDDGGEPRYTGPEVGVIAGKLAVSGQRSVSRRYRIIAACHHHRPRRRDAETVPSAIGENGRPAEAGRGDADIRDLPLIAGGCDWREQIIWAI